MTLTEERVVHEKEYRQDGIEVVLLKSPLTITEWNEILQNQKLRELVDKEIQRCFGELRCPKNEEYGNRLKQFLEESQNV